MCFAQTYAGVCRCALRSWATLLLQAVSATHSHATALQTAPTTASAMLPQPPASAMLATLERTVQSALVSATPLLQQLMLALPLQQATLLRFAAALGLSTVRDHAVTQVNLVDVILTWCLHLYIFFAFVCL